MPKNITSVTWSATGLPSALTINSATGVISGTPNVQPGDYTASVTVTTNYGTDTKPVTVRVGIPAAWLPQIDPNQIVNTIAGDVMTPYTVTGQNVTLGG
ncbi:MAG: putative Ig domain-containing protein [Synergistaceae bacterium]|nr:putative Ig domain-containing protein [Synergistaceae bacterium]